VEVEGVEGSSDESVRLVWRVAQEAVRNATRHARATNLEVDVRARDGVLVLDVSDDGDGFVPRSDSGGIGLRSLRDLIWEAGGSLDVRSVVGEGTTVHMEVGR
jgi:two-component system NarL family sensor kinase